MLLPNQTTPLIFKDIFDRLEQGGLRYVAVSGVAVFLHGYIRPICDLDIVIDAAPHETNRVQHALMLAGFVPSLPLPLSAVRVMRMFDCSGREIDVFLRFLIPFDELWADSRLMSVGDSRVRVMSLDHLICERRMRGRPYDLSDIEGLRPFQDRPASE